MRRRRKSAICPSCSRPIADAKESCPYCGEPLEGSSSFHLRLWRPLAFFLAAALAVSAFAGIPCKLGELTSAWLEALGIKADPLAESALPGILRALAVLILFLPVSRRVPGVPASLGVSEIACGIAWRLLLFADGALCVAIAKYIV